MPLANQPAKKVAPAAKKKAAPKSKAKAPAKPASKNVSTKSKAGPSKSIATPAKRVSEPKATPAAINTIPTKGRPSMTTKPTTIDDYLSHVDGETKALLQELRQMIRQLEPDAEECISYSMPAFRWRGKVIGGFAATREGGSYYPFSGTTLDTLGDALEGYSRTKSGLHFTRQKPLPRALVRQLLQARKAELGH